MKEEKDVAKFYAYKKWRRKRGKSKDPTRIERITIRFTQKECELIRDRAKDCGLPLSTFVRLTLLDKPPREGMPYDTIMALQGLSGVTSELATLNRKAQIYNYIDKKKLQEICDYVVNYLEDVRSRWVN
ncbi:MAG: hypothetical protein IKR04_02755 [Clostridia bacterium]|nr:hypothetical protein [Clostridia bacterium]